MTINATAHPRFRLLVRKAHVLEVHLDREAVVQDTPTIGEIDQCGFSIQSPEPNTDYQVRIGDIEPDEAVGRDFGELILWDQGPHFESARGRVWVFVSSRESGTDEPWRKRAELLVNILPTKLGEERYEAMLEDLRAVSVGLIFDLLSKSRLSLGQFSSRSVSSRPANVELVVIERLWSALSRSLQQITMQPRTGLVACRLKQLCWGSERLGRVGLRDLAMEGVDPRRHGEPRPFRATRERITESSDIPEHRTILGVLELLRSRVEDCQRRAKAHIASITLDRRFRDVEQSDGSNLYVDSDLAKIERLQLAVRRAEDLRQRMESARALNVFQGVAAELRLPNTPIFRNVLPYRRFRDEVLNYLATSLAILDEGVEERAKSTSRMYEQWIFVQLLSAFRISGLMASEQEGFLTRSARDRFTVDIDRGTSVWFRCGDGRALRVRYEPWIHPAALARSLRDSVYRGRSGESSWSPDVLIEVMSSSTAGGEPFGVDYAVVIDAKYTRQINQQHRYGAQKYNEIRRTFDDRPIVRQVWLAHPSTGGIIPWDEAIEWTPSGPSRPVDENVNGTIGAIPPLTIGRSEESEPNENILELVRGLVSYLELTPRRNVTGAA